MTQVSDNGEERALYYTSRERLIKFIWMKIDVQSED